MTQKPLAAAELNNLVADLKKLSRNLWWCWDQEAQDLFQELSPRAWQNLFHNAVAILHEVSDYELRTRLQDADFQERAKAVLHDFNAYLTDQNTWCHQNAPALHKNPVAYYSAEFGFHESLPISAGGLGILAGDHAKSASDLGLGFVGISLFYREGYFQQAIDSNNWQTEFYNPLDPQNVPVEPVLDAKGERLVCRVEIGLKHGVLPGVARQRRPRAGLSARHQPPGKRAAFPRPDAARLRRRQHDAHHAGNFAWHRRHTIAPQAGHPAVHVPHERGPRGVSHAGTHPRKNGRRKKLRRRAHRHEGRMPFHHAHAGRGRA